jgi:hypothetical protein
MKTCCFERCSEPATKRRGGEVYYPMCDKHWSLTRRIDRTTDHTCPGLARDIAYFAATDRSYYRCGEGHPAITVQYAQFSMICAECRRECLDESDVAPAFCLYCEASL